MLIRIASQLYTIKLMPNTLSYKPKYNQFGYINQGISKSVHKGNLV